ncbi:DUF192 domain-containing protein [Glaciecola sp. SC05]|uniref:DUF192 domain-containing protein n=1 Tax=Glaciecola sp. SC05 TaxID=1987355 RepID=UPI003526DFD3
MLIYKCRALVCLLLLAILPLQGFADQVKPQDNIVAETRDADEKTVALVFSNDVSIEVEFANDPQSRALGLMYRREMCENCGMLFKFDSVRIASIWMKNTYIPLDLAYINAFGKIIDIKQLVPHDLTSVASSMPVLYALEMNKGWFEKNGIATGDTVKLPSYIK